VAEDIKALDQPARAILRKYGVRFGAYHIYLPALLKPAPRALATQLWALKHESTDAKGVGELLHLASSGRTSIPVDKDTPKSLYRTAGYRVCGERAVRVDILERLADLIRPALSWRETSPGPKPDSAFDGRGFVVTGAMTSLTGASGEDFASILRSLGYRMERRLKPAEPAPPALTTPTSPPSAETQTLDALSAEALASDVPIADLTVVNLAALALAGSQSEPAAAERQQLESPPIEVAAGAPAEQDAPVANIAPSVGDASKEEQVTPGQPDATSASVEQANSEAPASSAPATERLLIEVWRPAGRFEKRNNRPRRPSRSQKPPVQIAVAASADNSEAATATAAASAAPAPAETIEKPRGPRSDRERKDRQQRQYRHERQQRMERQGQRSERRDAAQRSDRSPRRDRGDRVDRAEREQYYAKPYGGGVERRDKQPDPNSPFAKLAALKQQLEQTSKES